MCPQQLCTHPSTVDATTSSWLPLFLLNRERGCLSFEHTQEDRVTAKNMNGGLWALDLDLYDPFLTWLLTGCHASHPCPSEVRSDPWGLSDQRPSPACSAAVGLCRT